MTMNAGPMHQAESMNPEPPGRPKTKLSAACQRERTRRLQRACQRIDRAVTAGAPTQRTILRIARQVNGRPFRSDPSRSLKCSASSLRRFWDAWRLAGDSQVFALRYHGRPARIPAPPLVRFVHFLGAREHRSLRSAWQQFLALPRNAAWRKFNCGQIRRILTTAVFQSLRRHVAARDKALVELAQVRLAIVADLRTRLPDRIKRKGEPV